MEMAQQNIVKWVRVGILLFGLIEAAIGLCQLLEWYPSGYANGMPTGTMQNPGPFGGLMAIMVPISIGNPLIFVFLFSAIISGSRIAWIAAFVGLGLVIWPDVKHYFKSYLIRKLSVVLLCVIMSLMWYLKPYSALGRIHIWHISLRALCHSPFLGHGECRFKSVFMESQEYYFENTKHFDWEEFVAGAPDNAFNEFLDIAVTNGLPITILVYTVCISLVVCFLHSGQRLFAGGLLSAIVFSLSSYPFHQIETLFVIFLIGIVIAFVDNVSVYRKGCLLAFVTFFSVCRGQSLYVQQKRSHDPNWLCAKACYDCGDYSRASILYFNALNAHYTDESFLYEYGHTLHKLSEYKYSNEILTLSLRCGGDPMSLNVIGKNYEAMGEYNNAETYYQKAMFRLPNRLYPYYLLAKLYAREEFRNKESCQRMCHEVLYRKPKVYSPAVEQMQYEVRLLRP